MLRISPALVQAGDRSPKAVHARSCTTLESERGSERTNSDGSASASVSTACAALVASRCGPGFDPATTLVVGDRPSTDGSFAVKVRTGRVGSNEFRVVTDVDGTQVVSNSVVVAIS